MDSDWQPDDRDNRDEHDDRTPSEGFDEELGRARPPASELELELAEQRLRARLLGEPTPQVRVDRFVLERRLGSGGMGTVWRAHDEQLRRPVALKFLRSEGGGERARRRLLREAQALAQVSHPHVVPVYDVGEHEGRIWIAMEYVPGRTLRAWVAQDRPDREAVLDAWIAAGRGLEAVHAAGLIHRDVKPDNVMLGDDGRVRLVDFGLVRAFADEPGDAALATVADVVATHSSDSGELTATAQFVGTAAYAAPEQLAGAAVDPRADQYAFCVSVCEALVGQRPLVEQAPARGELLRLADGQRLPARILAALSRGLARAPEDRFEDMAALLDALAPRRRSWTLPVALLAALAGGVAAVALWPGEAAADPCADAGRAIAGIWTADRRERVAAGLGPAAGASVSAALDGWAARWRDAATVACEEVYVERSRSAASLDRRRACLDAQLDELDVLLDAGESGSLALELLGAGLAALDEPANCLAPAVIERELAAPSADQREAIAALRRTLFEARVGLGERDLDRRRATIEAVRRRAGELGYPPLLGEAALACGHVAREAGDAEAGRACYGEALDRAIEADDAPLLADAWNGLGKLALDLDLDLVDAEWIGGREARAIAELDDPRRRGASLLARGRIALVRGELEAAEQANRAAVAEFEAAGPTSAWLLAGALRNLATVVAARGRAEQAVEHHARARTLEQLHAAAPEQLARSTRGQAAYVEGWAQLELGEFADARDRFAEALVEYVAAGGPRTAEVAATHVGFAAVYDATGELAEARRHAELADAIVCEALGPSHPDRVYALSALGTAEFREGRFAAAVEAYARAVAISEQNQVAPLELATHRANLGEALFEDHQLDRAEPLLRRALAVLAEEYGLDHPELAVASKALAGVLLERGDAREARTWAERALAGHERQPESLVERAESRWLLARCLAALGERERAEAEARVAAREFTELGPAWQARAAQIREWIDSRDETQAQED